MSLPDRIVVTWRRIRRKTRNLLTDNPRSSYRAEEVEEFEHAFYERTLQPGMTVFDVGSNVGKTAAYFSARVGPSGKVHCFEPGESAWARLKALGEKPDYSNLVLSQSAVGAQKGVVQFHVYPESHSSWNTMADRPLAEYGIDVKQSGVIEVPCITLDEYCATHSVKRIHLAKLDVEGAELQVLQGARRLLSERRIDSLLLEFGQTTFDMGNAPHDIQSYADSVGYYLRNLIPGDPLFPGGKTRQTAQFAMLLLTARG
jgi:FkbM family methyltransferase